jgi:hypothetical protein
MTRQAVQTVVFDVSSHGLGHLGQIAPVIQKLRALFPAVRLVVRTAHPSHLVHDFIGPSIELDAPAPEAMPVSPDPSTIDTNASAAAYRELHGRWDEHLDRETTRLAAVSPTALVADVPYLSLAAAERLGIPSLAFCSLNWLDLYRAYCGPTRDDLIIRTIENAYHSARLFLQPLPHMPMHGLHNRRPIGPVARIGRRRNEELRSRLGITRNERVVLFTLGGIHSKRRARLPSIAGVHWLLGSNQPGQADHATDANQIDMSFIDLLASCDAVVTKVGYSTFVEAACNGVGLVSANRPDWPESTVLIDWAAQNASFALVEGVEDARGLRLALSEVLDAQRRIAVAPSGVSEAVDIIADVAGLRQPATRS